MNVTRRLKIIYDFLKLYLETVIHGCKVHSAVFHGSRVSGGAKPDSDLDVAVYVDKIPSLFEKQNLRVMYKNKLVLDVSFYDYDMSSESWAKDGIKIDESIVRGE